MHSMLATSAAVMAPWGSAPSAYISPVSLLTSDWDAPENISPTPRQERGDATCRACACADMAMPLVSQELFAVLGVCEDMTKSSSIAGAKPGVHSEVDASVVCAQPEGSSSIVLIEMPLGLRRAKTDVHERAGRVGCC